jgi:hypothetical protein
MDFLQKSFDDLNDYLVSWYIGVDQASLLDINKVASQMRRGVAVDAALSMVGLSSLNVKNLNDQLSVVTDVSKKIDYGLHAFSMLIGFGGEYYIDRRKNYSFTKATFYYFAAYAFLGTALQHQAIIQSLDEASVILENVIYGNSDK